MNTQTDLVIPTSGVFSNNIALTTSKSPSMKVLLQRALVYMNIHPEVLELKNIELTSVLQRYLGTNGQGTGNKVTDHEACIASVLEKFGFIRAPRGEYPTIDGNYYWYQLQGSQQSGDFLVFQIENGIKTEEVVLDAKHSNGTSIYLNDGIFEENTIYIVSFTRCKEKVKGERKKPREQVCFIGLGQDIMTEKDRATLLQWRQVLKEMNAKANDTDHLRLYARSANQYDCSRFGIEFTSHCWHQIHALLSPSSE
jgi:hypothetical protein